MVRGACFGGGVGLVCCVDVALATPDARFGITEVRVGVAPTPISTHMVNAMGLRHTRRYALTGETFDAAEAQRIGLVHEVVEAAAIEAKLATIIDASYRSGPGAMADTKRSFLTANSLLLTEGQIGALALEGAVRRAGKEGLEGTAAFVEKRLPAWYLPPVRTPAR
jgi:methylglutaconyl-CoA hydratase